MNDIDQPTVGAIHELPLLRYSQNLYSSNSSLTRNGLFFFALCLKNQEKLVKTRIFQ